MVACCGICQAIHTNLKFFQISLDRLVPGRLNTRVDRKRQVEDNKSVE